MSEAHTALAAQRMRYRRLSAQPQVRDECDYCASDDARDGDGEIVCLTCLLEEITSMADALRDVPGRRAWEASNPPPRETESRLDSLIGHSGDDEG
jgi:hypothetical protein